MSKMKKALILGITGQDGSYLAEILLEKGYEVHGFVRNDPASSTKNIDHILNRVTLHRVDLLDAKSLHGAIQSIGPDEIYNEADQSHVGKSFNMVDYQINITGATPARILEIIRQLNPKIKYFQPITSNVYGRAAETPQTEETPFRPQSPYACAKVLAYTLCRFYRDVYHMFAATAIFYNHESPRRPEEYVTRKITLGAARIKLGLQDSLELGDLAMKIDWGYAKEYMEAAWKIMQQAEPDDYIICTGETHSVQEFVDETFGLLGLNPKKYVRVNPALMRPASNTTLVGDYAKAKKAFGFEPKVKFKELLRLMVEADLKNLTREEPR